MLEQDLELLQEFIQETRDHLAEIEPDLLEMEQQGEEVSSEIVNRVFRAIHSTKGGAGFLGLDSLKDFSHAMENVLMLIRDGEMAATPEAMDVLLRAVDVLRAMVDDVQNCDQVPHQEEKQQLAEILQRVKGGGAPAPKPAEEKPAEEPAAEEKSAPEPEAKPAEEPAIAAIEEKSDDSGGAEEEEGEEKPVAPVAADAIGPFGISDEDLRTAFADGAHLYYVEVGTEDADMDAHAAFEGLGSVGRALSPVPEGGKGVIIAASVLAHDMLTMATGLPGHRLRPVETDAIKERLQATTAAEEAKAEEAPAADPAAKPAAESKPAPKAADKKPARFEQKKMQESLRVRVDLLTKLMNTAGELVLGRNQLLRALKDSREVIPGLAPILQHIDRVTSELQEGVMQTRMQPIGTLFGRYSRVVRDMSRKLGKKIAVRTEGEDVELDKSIIELLADPLTHIVRNCADHAIEDPDERQSVGKSPTGTISLVAYHESGQVNIAITDDGRGISRARVLKKAIERGLVSEAEGEQLTDRDVVNMVLQPGFSTAEKVSDISGRGVGMDVVRTNVEKLGGHIEMETEEGIGTTVTLRLPLTLAIIPSLTVRVGDARFAVPQVSIEELVWIAGADVEQRVESIQGAPVLRLRGRLLPLVRLGDVLNIVHDADKAPEEKPEEEDEFSLGTEQRGDINILVLRIGANRFGILVDELYETEEIVVKPLPGYLKKVECFAGTTILGDGKVTMILDPGGLSTRADLHFASVEREENRRREQAERARAAQSSRAMSVILFNSAPNEVFAVPQERVLRLERITRGDLKELGGQSYIEYRGAGLPIYALQDFYPVQGVPDDAEELYLIIPKHLGQDTSSNARGGILVWRIVDAMDVEVELNRPMFQAPGAKGAAIVEGNLTTFIDPAELLEAAEAR